MWVATVANIDQSHDLFGTLAKAPFDRAAQDDLHIQFLNPYIAFIMSQRAYLYGLPLVMLSLSILLVAVRRRALRLFVLAGVVAGFLPLAHLPTLLALAMVTPFLVFLLNRRLFAITSIPWPGWISFQASWVLVALPQLALQLRGGSSALSAFRVELGWLSAPDGNVT